MAHTNTINSTRLETLSKDNYDTWVIQVEALLVKNDTWPYVSGEKPRPESQGIADDPATRAAVAAWDIEDRKAKSDLILAISPTELKQVRGCKTSKDVWDKLTSIYDSKGPARKATQLKRLVQTKMPEGGDVKDHLAQFLDAVDKLESMDIDINGDLLSIMLLYSLPSSYENFRCAIESRDALPTVEQLKVKIIEEYEARNQVTISESGAMLAHRGKYNANAKSHKNTLLPRNEAEGKASTRSKFKCSFCKIPGHKYADCRKRKKQAAEKTNSAEAETFYADVAQYSSSETPKYAGTSKWCLDSGCTSHLCKDTRMISKQVRMQSDIKLANSATSTANARGDVEFTTTFKKRNKTIRLENTLHVPDLRTNLLSVAKIVDRGYRVTFDSNQATVYDPQGNTSLVVKREGDLYMLEGSARRAYNATQKGRSDLEVWHERLGHLNTNDILRMSRMRAASGFELKGDHKIPRCKVCLTQKLSSSPFASRAHRSRHRLEIVYSDLCGPMRTNSHGGARYFMTLIDDHSRWCHVYFLKSKDEAPSKFAEYKKFVENQTGLKVRAFHSDNGKEFCNSTMDRILKDSGIQRRLTIPHTPEQNGVAERMNRTLVEMGRCLLAQSGLPPSFWAEAIYTANHIRNRCITKTLGERTPYELWNNKKPDISHLRSFGCKAIYLNKGPNKGKFEPRSIEGVFVGYDGTSRGYRVWVPKDRKIVVARDVRFLDEFDEKSLQENFTDDTTMNGRGKLLDDGVESPEDSTTEIGNNNIERRPADCETERPPDSTEEDLNDPLSDDENDDTEGAQDPAHARGPGRPRRILTGRPGRPAKQYQTKRGAQESDRTKVAAEDSASGDQPDWSGAQFAMSASEIPFSQAVSGPCGDEWQDAIYEEIKSLIKNDTWTLVDRTEGDKVIGCRTVLRNKYKANGEIERRKARVVAKGFSQRPGVDFHDTFAPVARLASLRTLMALTVERDMQVSQIDITTAYLNGVMDTTVYMEKPELLRQMLERIVTMEDDTLLNKRAKGMLTQLRRGDKICKLNKSLYGLRQAGRRWYLRLDATLRGLGLTPTNSDPCVYHDAGNHILLLVYVDDIILASRDASLMARIKRGLARAFTIKDLGAAKYCLGIEIARDEEAIHLSQAGYIRDILERFGMADCKPVGTPMVAGTKLENPSDGDDTNNPAVPYRELLGSLMYLAQGTRPDIAYAVSALSQRCTSYTPTHWGYAKRVLRYLKGTINHGLTYMKSGQSLVGFADADWGNCGLDRRSYTGTVFILSSAAISWDSKKQRTVALSSTEAEYTALSDAAREAIYLSSFLSEIGLSSLSRVTLHNDNQGAGKLAVNPVFHSRSKHIDIKRHFIRQALSENRIDLVYTPTDEMVADVLTKALSRDKHLFCIDGIGVKDI